MFQLTVTRPASIWKQNVLCHQKESQRSIEKHRKTEQKHSKTIGQKYGTTSLFSYVRISQQNVQRKVFFLIILYISTSILYFFYATKQFFTDYCFSLSLKWRDIWEHLCEKLYFQIIAKGFAIVNSDLYSSDNNYAKKSLICYFHAIWKYKGKDGLNLIFNKHKDCESLSILFVVKIFIQRC